MRESTTEPTVPAVSTETFDPVVRTDGGRRTRSTEGKVPEAPLVPDLS